MTDHFPLSAAELAPAALSDAEACLLEPPLALIPGLALDAFVEGLQSEPARASAASSPAARAIPREKWVRLSIEVPPYVAQALKQRALDRGCSVRHLLMVMMRSHKIQISDADMCEDGRKTNRRKS